MFEATPERPSDVLSIWYGVLFTPNRTFGLLDLSRASGPAAGAVAWVAGSLALAVAGPQPWALLAAFVGWVGVLGVAWATSSGHTFLMARALHHSGDWAPLGAAMALAMLPWAFVGPLFALAQAGHGPWAALGLLGLALWSARLQQVAIRAAIGLASRQTTRLLMATSLVAVGLPALAIASYLLILLGVLGRGL